MSQGDRIVLKLRELILSGELAPGRRLTEIAVAERLGVSRTPVRYALAVLAKEGLLVAAGGRGFVIREFSLKDILDAIEVRGALEGLAARLVAETGRGAGLAERLAPRLAEGADILRAPDWPADGDARWAAMNGAFHRAIVEAAANRALIDALSLNDKLPFAAAAALLGGDTDDRELLRQHRQVLVTAQQQHEAIVDALKRGQGRRVEALMSEHALAARNNNLLFQARIAAIAEPGARTASPAATDREVALTS
jgi:GntR family transcriptional regulator of vanillate catabolism